MERKTREQYLPGKISVIVPIYNVEKYVEQCIDSILEQTYKNLEIILIDDGSTDLSSSICDEYAKRDDRIVLIHKENGGAASAKNVGLRIATGEYVSFVDGDDYLEPDAYEYMVSKLIDEEADIVHCNHRDVYKENQNDRIIITNETNVGSKEYLVDFTKKWINSLLWDKLYRRKIFNNIYFEEGHKIDDEFFTYQGVMNATKIVSTPKVVYNYRKRKSSVMLSVESQEEIFIDRLDYLNKRRKKVVEKFPELKREFDYDYLNTILFLSGDTAITIEAMSEIKRLIKEFIKEEKIYGINFHLLRRLLILRYTRTGKLITKCKKEVEQIQKYEYFE